jgi:hypothetical protein
MALDMVESTRADLSFLPPISPVGLRRERVREGIFDMALFTVEGCLHQQQTSGLLDRI